MTEPRRILIVEDNADAAEGLAAFMEVVGYVPAIAPDGLTGVEAAQSNPPAAILCDIGLPGISGYEVAKRLRQDERLRSVPMVAITGYAQYSDRQHALSAGFDEHMAKPVDLDRLLGFLADRLPDA